MKSDVLWFCTLCLFVACHTTSAGSWDDKFNSIHDKLFPTLEKRAKYRDCEARWSAGERQAGEYTIYPNGTYPTKVYCNHTATATFTLIQRRMYGNIPFDQSWSAYKVGFGSTAGDFWAGLETIHHLTTSGSHAVRIDITDWAGNSRYATYNNFIVMPESDRYKLYVSSPSSGTLVDDLTYANGCQFGTVENPDYYKCATQMRAGWWYNYCAYALLNGKYYHGGPYTPTSGYYDGIFWKDWGGYNYSFKYVAMSVFKP